MNEKLELRIERFLRAGQGDFESLALELFAYQFQKNAPYRAYCQAQGRGPENVSSWIEIPAVPIAAFKSAELATFPLGQAAAVFHSSGTTQKTRSRHFLKTLTYYEAALTSSFGEWVVPDEASLPFLILAPSPGEAPHSSLSWMLDVVKRKWGATGSNYFVQNGRVDERRLFQTLKQNQDVSQPVTLLGTTLSFLRVFEQCAKQRVTFQCASGSRVMDTGGMKTREHDVSRGEFLRLVWTYLGIPEARCINEYGMCEMSSQFYARGASAIFKGPPWVRTWVVDPHTGEPLQAGQAGLLRHFDLANVDSVMALQTEDEAEARTDGFHLKGRAPAAELKGCSIDMEAYLKRS